ncbi:adenosine deaminase [Thalassotalea agarivorans]|uniref:adenosine deaminase n=1 Tax=Thalassotalea agarivorans TaxID=349064 RepID=A0A1I0DCF4_THASX|nr:adenosine deaminase [Thalassotalea agarivorans]SET29922.1 adenosine deaminase [Thalassotalea agarivorans]
MHSYLPLLDLHRHLDGNIRPRTIWALAQKNGIELPANDIDSFLPHVQIQKSEPDLLAFLAKLDWGVAVLKDLDDVKRVAYENIEDAYNAGIDYAELRFSPLYMAMNHHLNPSDVVAAVIDGVEQGKKAFPVECNLIGIMSRTFGYQKCEQELNAILSHRDAFVAIDLAGDELNKPGSLFTPLFDKARKLDLAITVHAGEAAGSDSVWQAITQLGAQRIGHGVAAATDQKLMTFMAENDIAIESCLTSNFQTGTITDLTQHPLPVFLENGIKACLNTDDPAVSGIELVHEYKQAKQWLNLDKDAFEQLQNNSLSVAFLSEHEKQTLMQKPRNLAKEIELY